MNDRTIVIGTRGSRLALWQAEFTQEQLRKLGYTAMLKIISTKGDQTQLQNLSFDKLEGKGFFTKELEEELLGGQIDMAVHSYKDLPTDNPAGLIIAGCSYSEDPADWLVVRKESVDPARPLNLKQGAKVGTSSARRKAQLLAHRPDLEMVDIRGNVPTRIEKIYREGLDAVVLAAAGLKRLDLDLSAYHVERLGLNTCISAPAQGVLAYQIRQDDAFMSNVIALLNDADVSKDVYVERGILKKLGGGCQQPIGVYCDSTTGIYRVWAAYALQWDDFPRRIYMQDADPDALIDRAVEVLKKAHENRRIFISRHLSPEAYFWRALTRYGFEVIGRSLIEFEAIAFGRELPDADWLFFSSKNGVRFFFDQQPQLPPNVRIAALGNSTAKAVAEAGYITHFVGQGSDTHEVAIRFAEIAAGQRVIFPQPLNSLEAVQQAIGHLILPIKLICYRNTPVSEGFDLPPCDILVFTSPANARNYLSKYPILPQQKIIVIGPTTAAALQEAGITDYIVSPIADEVSLADLCY